MTPRPERILIVKLSSLGDVVHALPALQDLRRARPQARIDWVVEPGFAGLVRRAEGIGRVIEAPLRRWKRDWRAGGVWREFMALRASLQAEPYDAVIDLQGLGKSAAVARLARLAHGGHRYGLGNRTDGSSWEPLARWLVDRPIRLPKHLHALDRSRELVARALGQVVTGPAEFGLTRPGAGWATNDSANTAPPTLALVHGTSRADKLWPADHWLAFGQRVLADGWRIALPQGSAAEHERALALAAGWGEAAASRVDVWPTLGLDAVVDRLARTQGVVGVDSGLSHIAVALELPHVQIYNFPTAWRTGPQAAHGHRHQVAVEGTGAPGVAPDVDAVWRAWQTALAARAEAAP